MKKPRRLYLIGLIALVFVAWIYLWFFRGNRKVQGVYITCGGQSYLKIKSGFFGSPRIEEGLLFHTDPKYPLKQRTIKSHFRAGRLILEQEDIYSLRSVRDHDEYQISFRFECQPSKTVSGDWDLVRGEIETILKTTKKPFSQKLWLSESAKEFWSNLTRSFKNMNYFHFVYEAKDAPLSSFLHRVDDPQLAEYYRLRINGDRSGKALQPARKLAANHPDDPFLSLHLVEMEALGGDAGKAFGLWEKWQNSHGKSSPPLLLHMAKRVSQTIDMARWKSDHPEEVSPLQVGDSSNMNLRELFDCYKNALSSEQLFTSDTTIVSPTRIIFCDIHSPDDLSFNLYPITRTMARLYYFQGRQGESLELFASFYRLAQSLSAFGGILQRRYGFMWLNFTPSKDLLFHVLNACSTKEDFIFCRDVLNRLHRFNMDEDVKSIFDDELSPLVSFMKPGIRMNPLIYAQFSEPRQKLTRMNLQLVRAACAARYYFTTTGNFPNSPKDFAPFLEEGIPRDLFTEKDPIRFFAAPDGDFVLYSLGPDGNDDKASVIYDKFNMESDNGDIVLKIPLKREFPFPGDKVRAANAYELLEQFPNGLPLDGFSNKRESPLSILESTDKHPLVIFSFGPDWDEADYKPLGRSDLEKIEPVPTPEPEPGCTINRNLQKVLRRSETVPSPPGYWTLEPMYDPTNGANSNGDLFIEIPR